MRPATKGLRGGRRAGPLGLLALAVLTSATAQGQPAAVGQWTGLLPWPDTGTHLVLLPTGKVLSWGEFKPDEFHLWDPATGAFTVAAHPGYNAFCGGHSLLADGRVLVTGGHIDSNVGEPKATIYEPKTNTWTRLPDMNAGRWYPTNTALPNGEMLVTAGTATARRVGENRLPQVWQPSLNRWRDLTGAVRTVDQYPWMFVAPNGKVFMAGPDPESLYLDTSGTGAWTEVAPRHEEDRFAGSAVMYDDGKVMVCGGGDDAPTETVEVIDLSSPSPAWRATQPMGWKRKQHNATLLPDGTVLVTGGSSGPGKSDDSSPVLATELWDPATERFTVLAPSLQFRGYHSNALLLPDARVLSVGGEDTEEGQIFSPPYLFKGPRPTITAAPAAVGYGETFTVSTPNAASIARVTWLRPGSPTHAYNQGQRINRLAFTREAGALRVTAPANSSLAPPGHYMLFLLSDKGVPSVASWVKVGGQDAAPPAEVRGVSVGDAWKYDDRGTDPGPSWVSPTFDDSGWRVGRGAFASAGDGVGTQLQPQDGQATVYFRKKLVLHGPAVGGRLRVQHDDGVVVWLNGTRVLSRNVGGTEHKAWASAAAPAGGQASEVAIPAGVLVEGENVVAVMVKRVKPTKANPEPALRFDLELGVNTLGQVEPVPLLSLTTPNGGEMLEGGSTYEVSWSTLGTLAEVRLEYSADGGARWESIEDALPNSGSYAWRVPELGSAQVLLRVAGTTAPASADASDAPFTITVPPVGCSNCEPEPPKPPVNEVATCGDLASGLPPCTHEPPRGKVVPSPEPGCSTTGLSPPALGLLVALTWALRRRRR